MVRQLLSSSRPAAQRSTHGEPRPAGSVCGNGTAVAAHEFKIHSVIR
jgi:hypothetical protein